MASSACGGARGRELFLPTPRLTSAEAIVVLGNRPPRDAEGRVAPETARRVRRGVELYRDGLAPRLVVTGGPAPGGGTEADVMAGYAIELGVPEQAILRERRSRDTVENARRTVELLCRGRADCDVSVIVVSTPYHLRRAVRLFRCAGARVQWAAAEVPGDVGTQIGFAAYEYGVRLAYAFDDPCERARPRRSRRPD